MVIQARQTSGKNGKNLGLYYWWWCPGCEESHVFNKRWEFNGDLKKPTFTPSYLVQGMIGGKVGLCHSFVKAGMIEFLGDCTHALAGQTVPMVELPPWID